MVDLIYPTELQLNRANSSDTEAPVLDLKLCIKKGKRKVQGMQQSQTAALPRSQEEEETDKCKQAQTEQTYEKH